MENQTATPPSIPTSADNPLTLIAPNGSWSISLTALDVHTAETLIKLCRRLYPHDSLGDLYYADVVAKLDAKAAADGTIAQALQEGVAHLDRLYGVTWLNLSAGYQMEALHQIENTPFFQTVRAHVVVTLYNDPRVWTHLGYEGSSFEKGGYLNRGFNDISWLPNY